MKNKNQWFMDDGSLTRQLCPEDEDGPEENETLEPCCACDEAKYEVGLSSLPSWSQRVQRALKSYKLHTKEQQGFSFLMNIHAPE